jgi:hypothetical protein
MKIHEIQRWVDLIKSSGGHMPLDSDVVLEIIQRLLNIARATDNIIHTDNQRDETYHICQAIKMISDLDKIDLGGEADTHEETVIKRVV